jgi:hypothetical protein
MRRNAASRAQRAQKWALSGHLGFSCFTMRKTHNGAVWRSPALLWPVIDFLSEDFHHGARR